MSRGASQDEVAAKLVEMGVTPSEAERLARGEAQVGRPFLSPQHRAAISRTKQRRAMQPVARGPVAGVVAG